MTCGVRKLTVVDGGCVAIPDVVKQSLYIGNDCGVPRATAIVPHLKERCPAVEVEGIQMEIPVPRNPVSPTKMSSVLDNCKRFQALVASSDVVFLLTDTWESRWFPTLLCANENEIAITSASGYDSYLVMRHGAGPGHNLSTEDALGHQRLGSCFYNNSSSFVNVYYVLQLVLNEIVAMPGLTSIASGKAVELFARILHHEEG
uniref:THIF-type NAD/FAD binding fold domain-containing protein n=1 Tax=Triticum urartu TaxID=4572 RepID=A0A8R7PFL1_TRIUA